MEITFQIVGLEYVLLGKSHSSMLHPLDGLSIAARRDGAVSAFASVFCTATRTNGQHPPYMPAAISTPVLPAGLPTSMLVSIPETIDSTPLEPNDRCMRVLLHPSQHHPTLYHPEHKNPNSLPQSHEMREADCAAHKGVSDLCLSALPVCGQILKMGYEVLRA